MSNDKIINVADEEQVKHQVSRVKRIREREMSDIRYILQSIQGRRFMWRLMEFCKPFESIWESSARIHYNSGKQDVGHFLMGEITEADDDKFLQMMREAKRGELNDV